MSNNSNRPSWGEWLAFTAIMFIIITMVFGTTIDGYHYRIRITGERGVELVKTPIADK